MEIIRYKQTKALISLILTLINIGGNPLNNLVIFKIKVNEVAIILKP